MAAGPFARAGAPGMGLFLLSSPTCSHRSDVGHPAIGQHAAFHPICAMRIATVLPALVSRKPVQSPALFSRPNTPHSSVQKYPRRRQVLSQGQDLEKPRLPDQPTTMTALCLFRSAHQTAGINHHVRHFRNPPYSAAFKCPVPGNGVGSRPSSQMISGDSIPRADRCKAQSCAARLDRPSDRRASNRAIHIA